MRWRQRSGWPVHEGRHRGQGPPEATGGPGAGSPRDPRGPRLPTPGHSLLACHLGENGSLRLSHPLIALWKRGCHPLPEPLPQPGPSRRARASAGVWGPRLLSRTCHITGGKSISLCHFKTENDKVAKCVSNSD